MSKRTGKRALTPPARPFGILDGVFILLCGALVLLILAAALLPRLLGYMPYAISSNSMSPTLNRGDLVFAAPTSLDSLGVGDIVVFETETGPITHRVYSIDEISRTLRTKADRSVHLDPAPVTERRILGRVYYKLPLLGHISLAVGGKETVT